MTLRVCKHSNLLCSVIFVNFYNFFQQWRHYVVTCQLSAQEIVNWVTTADAGVHTADTTQFGATEIAGQENAGLENDGRSCRAGKCKTGKWRTKVQGWKMQDRKITDKFAGVENAGLEIDGQKLQGVENDGHSIKGYFTAVHVHHGPCTFTCNSTENSKLLITVTNY